MNTRSKYLDDSLRYDVLLEAACRSHVRYYLLILKQSVACGCVTGHHLVPLPRDIIQST